MLNIPKKYQVDENGKKIAVLLDIEVYCKIEEVLERNGLNHLIEEDLDENTCHDKSSGVFNKFG